MLSDRSQASCTQQTIKDLIRLFKRRIICAVVIRINASVNWRYFYSSGFRLLGHATHFGGKLVCQVKLKFHGRLTTGCFYHVQVCSLMFVISHLVIFFLSERVPVQGV